MHCTDHNNCCYYFLSNIMCSMRKLKFHFRILPKLYYNILSPPSRVVLLVANILKIRLELIEIDIAKKQQMDPAFIQVKFPQFPMLTIQFVFFCIYFNIIHDSYLFLFQIVKSATYYSNIC